MILRQAQDDGFSLATVIDRRYTKEMDDLFASGATDSESTGRAVSTNAPLAARFRPRTIEEYIGQAHLLAPGKPLRRLIEADRLTSLILFGPPGVGKTSLAEVIAR